MESRVFIGNLPYDVTESDVEWFLRGYWPIRHISMRNGHAFVVFMYSDDAFDAIEDLDGLKLGRQRVVVELVRERGRRRYRPPTPSAEYRTVRILNLASSIGWPELKDFMNVNGGVVFADAHRPNLNEGVVEFATERHAREATWKLDKTILNGSKIRIRRRIRRSSSRSPSPPTPASSVRYPRSRSRSRSRSNYTSRSSSSSSDSTATSGYTSSSGSSSTSHRSRNRYSRSRSRSPCRRSRSHRSWRRSADTWSEDESIYSVGSIWSDR